MDLTAQTEKSGSKLLDITGFLKASESKASRKGNCAFADVFAAHVHEKTAGTGETTIGDLQPVGVQNLSGTVVEKGGTFTDIPLDSQQNVPLLQESKATDLTAFFFQGANDVNPGLAKEILNSDLSENQAFQSISFHQNDNISIDDPAEGLKEGVAVFFYRIKQEAPVVNINSENAEGLNDLISTSGEETTTAAMDIAKKASASNEEKKILVENKIEQLKDIMAAFLYAIKSDESASTPETENTQNNLSDLTSGKEATAAATDITQQISINNSSKATLIENKIEQMKATLAAFLDGVKDKTPTVNNDEYNNIEQLKEILTAFLNDIRNEEAAALVNADNTEAFDKSSLKEMPAATAVTAESAPTSNDGQSISQETKVALLKDILTAFVQEFENESAASQNSRNINTISEIENPNAPVVNAAELTVRKNSDSAQKSENSRAAFVNRIAELLRAKGNEGSFITDMITRIRNLSGTVQRKAASALDVKVPEANFSNANRMGKDIVQPFIMTDLEKQATGKTVPSQIASGEDGIMMSPARQEAQIPVQAASKIKYHNNLDISAQRASTIVLSASSNAITNEAQISQGVKIQSLIDQITQAKQQMETDFGRVKITLNPPNLGIVDLEVVVRQNRVEVTMIADKASVQQLLNAHSEEVKSALQRQDMKIDTFQVLLQNNNDGQQQQSNHWASMKGNNGQESAYFVDHEESADQPLTGIENPASSSRGLVSIFV